MNEFNFYSKLVNEIDCLVYDQCDSYDAIEGLNSNIIGRMFVAICDTFAQLASTFGTNLTRMGKDLKRSELNEFVKSNRLMTYAVDKVPYHECIDVDVDVPANMKVTYKAAVDSLVQVYTRLNALNNAKLVDIAFREMLNSINTSDPKLAKQVTSTEQVVTRIVNVASPAIDLCLSQYEAKFSYKRPFGKLFLTTQDWVYVRNTLIENEYRLQDVSPMCDVTASIEGTLKQIAIAAESNDTPVKPKDLKNMAEITKGVALILDSYGMAATRQMALEHNYVLCLNHIYSTVK